MIIKYPEKKLSKCSKQELILLLQGEIENQEKLIKRIEKEYTLINSKFEDTEYPSYKDTYQQGYLDGMETVTNMVTNFYHYEDDNE